MELDAAVCDRARLTRDSRFDGRFFIAVLSTGVYCRPICPSSHAKRVNVRYFGSAEEAVAAGFRPCLRCRPESAPGTPAWNGTSATVGRALRLITEGALQEHGVAGLSERLGVSTRHLHRLFLSHLGASPIAVASTWRLHFAKQLISDTDLPMFRVALASGFRSVRRFNDSIRGLYGRTPSELRRPRPVALRARQDEYVFRLTYRPPYDWESLLAFLGTRAIPGVEEVVSGAYRRSFALEGRHGILEIRHAKSVQALEVRVRFSEPLSLLPIVTRLRSMFDLGADASAITQHFRKDPLLGPLAKRYPGLRVPGAWDGFELAVRAILGQQVTVAAATTLAGRLAQRLGEPLSLPDTGGLSVVFPTARALAHVRLKGLPQVRARAIRALARGVASGRLLPFAGTDEEASLASLARVKGIGEWTAQYIAMRTLRQPDAFPANDLVLLRAVGQGQRLTATALRERAERWRPWRAYAALYLWRAAADQAQETRVMPKRLMRYTEVPTPVGRLLLAGDEEGLRRISFQNGSDRVKPADGWQLSEEPFREAIAQLHAYFAGRLRNFDLVLAPEGTPFQREVWSMLRTIPYGEIVSYGEMARRLGRPNAYRAVGAANGSNPIPIVIPCHRVIGSGGSLTGFGGGLAIKRRLLDLEAGDRQMF